MKYVNGKISVCMATYNGEKYIGKQLESILVQIGQGDEVIVSDDYSTDLTVNIVLSINDPRIIVIYNKKPGIANNFENALKYASGDIIVIADQDDIWLDGKIEVIRSNLVNNDLVVMDCIVVDESLNIIYDSLFKLTNPKNNLLSNLIKNNFTGCCMAFKKWILFYALPFPRSLPMHDWWIGIVAASLGRASFIDHPCILYRRHSSNASSLTNKSHFSLINKCYMRLYIIIHLIKLFTKKYFQN